MRRTLVLLIVALLSLAAAQQCKDKAGTRKCVKKVAKGKKRPVTPRSTHFSLLSIGFQHRARQSVARVTL